MKKFPSGTRVEVFESLDSTQLEAKRRASANEKGPLWIIAKLQTGGYGRRGRTWCQQIGDFSGTLLFDPETAAENYSQISYVTTLAVASCLEEFIPENLVAAKWPNDVLIESKKCNGILLETMEHDAGLALGVGVGINIVSAPENLPYPTARLVDYNASPPSPLEVAAALDRHFWTFFDYWKKQGFSRIRALWLEKATGLNQIIHVRLSNEELTGVFEGIDELGGLILRLDTGTRIIKAGEVFFSPHGNRGENAARN